MLTRPQFMRMFVLILLVIGLVLGLFHRRLLGIHQVTPRLSPIKIAGSVFPHQSFDDLLRRHV